MKEFGLIFLIFLVLPFWGVAQSVYEENFIIPPFDANNPEMKIISTDADWDNINDPSIKYFYVQPGDYNNAGIIQLTQSGTADAKRYISLYNGNDSHPGKLNVDQLARVALKFVDTDFWIVDRMAYWGSQDGRISIEMHNSDNNIINRFLSKNVQGGAVYLYPGSDNNTIQNCRVQRDVFTDFMDRAAFGLYNDSQDNISIKNTHIINNEVYNFIDGFQSIKSGSADQVYINYEGTIVDYNHFYIDNSIYTDCNGNQDPNGECAYSENAIDLKSGSENADNPMIISNNMCWGFRKSDQTNSALGDFGIALVAHFGTKNVKIFNNLFYDSNRGVGIGGPKNGYAMKDSEFHDNIFHTIRTYSVVVYDAKDLNFNHNLHKEIGPNLDAFSYWMVFNDSPNMHVEYNISEETKDLYGVIEEGTSTLFPFKNEYFNSTPGDMADDSDIIHASSPTSEYEDLVFITDRYTNNPKTITIPKVIKPSVLPVELDHFLVRNDGYQHVLSWRTLSEKNTSHFSIQHSTDAQNWKSIGQITASTNSAKEKQYNYKYKDFVKSNYYRLQTVDLDGSFEYSKIIFLAAKETRLKLSPNPSTDFIKLENTEPNTLVRIFNSNGTTLLQLSYNGISINVSELPAGTYYISVHGLVRTFIKQ